MLTNTAPPWDRVVPLFQTKPAGWSNPDLSLLGNSTAPAPEFPRAVLGEMWNDWCAQNATAANAPYDYVAGGLLTLAAALIGNARVAGFGEWTAPSIIWTANIGAPSAKKSPAMAPFKRAIAVLEAELADETYIEDEKTPPPQIHVGDVTERAAQEVVAANPKGVVLVLDELSAMWTRASRPGVEQFYIEAYGGSSYIVNRKGQSPLRIPHLSISMLGGTQPDTVRDLVEARTNRGFASRWLYVYPEPVVGFQRPTRVDQTAAMDAFRRLSALELSMGEPLRCDLSPEAEVEAEGWLVQHNEESSKAEGLWQQWCGKQDGMLLRYALVLEHLWWAADPSRDPDGPVTISEAAIYAAATFIDSYAKPMAMRAFNQATRPEEEQWASFLVRLLRNKGVKAFNAREVRRNELGPVGELAHPAKMAAACEILAAASLIRHVGARAGDTKGRAPANYEVNPLLLSASAPS